MVVAYPVSKVPEPAYGNLNSRLVAVRGVWEGGPKFGPESVLFLRHHLVPKAEGQLGDDLSGTDRFSIGLDTPNSLVDINIWIPVTLILAQVSAEYGGVVKNPGSGAALFRMNDRHLFIYRVSKGYLEETQGFPKRGRNLGIPIVEPHGGNFVASALKEVWL